MLQQSGHTGQVALLGCYQQGCGEIMGLAVRVSAWRWGQRGWGHRQDQHSDT